VEILAFTPQTIKQSSYNMVT